MSDVVAVISDLIFRSRVAGAARAAGASVTFAASSAELADRLTGGFVQRVLIDLNLPNDDGLRAIAIAAGAPRPPRIIAFCAHVQADLAQAAAKAGAHRVLARSAFVAELDRLLTAD